MLCLYDGRLSGNSWKVRVLLSQLQLPFRRVTLDLQKGETQHPAFRAKSRFGRVPVLELEDGRTVVESDAILMYLAHGTRFLPDDPFLRAEVLAWLFFEQADLQKAIALPRVYHLRGLADSMAEEIRRLQAEGYAGLRELEQFLIDRTWLVGESYSVADLAVSTYVSLAHQGGYEMGEFTAIHRWLLRVKAQPGWIDVL